MSLVLGSESTSMYSTTHFFKKTSTFQNPHWSTEFSLDDDKSSVSIVPAKRSLRFTIKSAQPMSFVEVWGKIVKGSGSPDNMKEADAHNYGGRYFSTQNERNSIKCQCYVSEEESAFKGGHCTFSLYLWYRKFKAVSVPLQIAYEDSTRTAENQSSLASDLESLLDSPQHSDVGITFTSGGRSGHEWNLHECILAARSSILAEIESIDISEFEHSEPSGFLQCIMEGDESLEAMIRFIYTDILDNQPLDTLKKLLPLADRFQIPVLKSKCGEMLSEMLTKENALELCFMAAKYNEHFLRKAATRFVAGIFSELSCNDDWLKLMKTEPQLANEIILLKCSR